MNKPPPQDELDLLAMLDAVLGRSQSNTLTDFLKMVANQHLIILKEDRYLQYGNKLGQSLYAHILDGIFVLDQLAHLFSLPEHEVKVLFTAYTIHDINKLLDNSQGLNRDAVPEQVVAQITRFGLDQFFLQYREYLSDVTTLARGHGGHTPVHGETLIVRDSAHYGLGLERVLTLLQLIKAVDILDLSHTLDEQHHKQSFLSQLNAFALNYEVQYTFFTHRLDESRGALTNMLHNAISIELNERYGLLPLLIYPEGVVYLVQRGKEPRIDNGDRLRIAARAVDELVRMTGIKFDEFIEVRPLGIKVDAKCLALGLSFSDIWNAIYAIVQRRTFKPEELAQKARLRTKTGFTKNAAQFPEAVPDVEALLEGHPIAQSDAQLRIGELIRSYFIFLNDHFAKAIPQPWERIYDVLEISAEQRRVLAFFDARMDRAYVLARDLPLSEEIVKTNLLKDGQILLADRSSDDPRVPIFTTYLERHALFGSQGREGSDAGSLMRYVAHQHKQCVQCSDDFPTMPWMSADVRSDISVQTFSNRLRGGQGEPKKNICVLCQTQYLVERLSYEEIRGEHTVYLHLYPYTFFTKPFIEGLRQVLKELKREDSRALWLDGDRAMRRYTTEQRITAPMLTRTKAEKPHTFGVYLPSYAEALLGNLLIFPLNPAGKTDTERFLFALEYALILQRYFGCRVILSANSVVPFSQDSIGDLTTDMTPLACRGLIEATSYYQFPKTGQASLKLLWEQMQDLYTIKRQTGGGKDDPLLSLVEALAYHPLGIFYATEKLIEGHARDSHNAEWMLINISREVFHAVERLAHSKGTGFMEQLSTHMRHLAQIAWKHRLIGRTLTKHSLMTALDEVLRKFAQRSKATEHDTEALKAATVEDIFAYLERVADEHYKPGRTKWEAIKEFVDVFYTGIYANVYGNSPARLLSDEKLLRSTYMFYMREQIPRKISETADKGELTNIPADADNGDA
ncbi:type I-D CRISPR-associated protein Cas10d/Csc3 [Candidatus Chloroploca sp. Khr17]|uniref:type I-D CRISPR-associated protein Cas10d/Csc3 n=1 Tax=Candidatus Chloroploca sp. Khr17 TaxID=2496869 RepID=UPI00101C6741|nr:type I-D CRISPR-associated protein Cas10d/Csc3 [Candidatus Chloroploca sp. Khr17]